MTQGGPSAFAAVMRKALKESKIAHRARSHDNKVPFVDQASADVAARRMDAEFPGEEFNSYQCQYCQHWHIGHVRDRK